MPCIFSYSGTEPHTVVNFRHDPQMGDWDHSREWMSPRIKAAAGQNSFAYDRAVVSNIQTLSWKEMYAADATDLITFLAAVDGISNVFDFTDPAGGSWTARIWNAGELRMALSDFNRYDVTVELLVDAA
jgi:hypothetical protein